MSLIQSRFKEFFVLVLLCISSLSASAGITIYYSGMSTASDWSEGSNAANETGDATGGIRVVDGDKVQMNGWWDSAGWTSISRSTGWTIAANKEYALTINMISYSSSTAVVLKLTNVTEGGTVIASVSVNPSTSAWGDYSVSFSTAGGQNSGAVGDVLGIAVEPGWWNNVGITSVKMTEKDSGEPVPAESYSIDINTAYQTFTGLGVGTIFYQSHLTDGSPEADRPNTYKKLFTDIPHGYHMIWFRPNSETTNDNSDPYDVNLSAFTMAAENEDYVTILNESITRNPGVKLAATVMTPPAWLKTNRSTYGNGTLDTSVPNAYLEFAEFVFANLLWYKQQGFSFEVVTLMNEPDYTHTAQDGATYTAAQARDVHKYTVDHIRYLVNSAENTAGVVMPLIMMPSTLSVSSVNSYVNSCKTDGYAWNNINMISTHHYGGGTLSNYQSVFNNIQDKPLIMSEWHSANNNDIDPPAVEVMEQSDMIITALNGGAKGCWWFETNHPGSTIPGLCMQPWGSAAVFGKTYYSWKQWSVMSRTGSIRVGNTITGTGNQLSSVVLKDAVHQVVVLQIINQSASSQYIGVSIPGQSINLIQHNRTSETEDFAPVSFIIPSYPTGETVLFVAAQSLNTFELYYGTPDSSAPAVPVNLTAKVGDSAVTLDWNDNVETDLAGYSVYRSTVMGGPYTQIASGLVYSEYVDTNITAGLYYYYVVKATDGSGNESPASSQAAAGIRFYHSDMSTLSGWTESSDFTGEAGESTGGIRVVSSEYVQMNSWWDSAGWTAIARGTGRTITAGKEYIMRANLLSFASGAVALKFQNVTEGLTDIVSASVYPLSTNWSEFVVSFSTAGGQNSGAVGDELGIAVNAGWWNNIAVTDITVTEYEVEADITPPAIPTGLAVTAGNGSVSLNWNDNTEPDLTGYNVKRATVSGGPYSTIAGDITVSAYTDNAVTNGTTYYYVVSAKDISSNESANSSQTSATPQDTAPPTPNPAAFATAPYATGSDSIAMVAATGSDVSGPVEYLFTETSGNPGGTSSGWQTSTSYTDTSLNAGTQYTYTVTMRDALGNTGTSSAPASATTQAATPPTFVAAGAIASGTGTITPALPSGIAAGDILLLFLETANQAISISNQNGGTWTAVTSSPQGTGTAGATSATRLTVFWSRYNGTQGAPTTSDSGNHQIGRMIAIRGAAASGNPWDVTAGGIEAASDTSGSIPGATTTVANTLVVAAVAGSLPDATGTANFSAWTNANLTSLTERTDNTANAGNGGAIGIATGVKATAGAYGSTTVTHASSAVKGMISIAIKK